MNVPYVEYIIFGLILATSVVATHFFTKRKYRPKDEPIVDVVQPPAVLALRSAPATVVQDVEQPKNLNHWKLEVNGNAKFDIKVEWSDGDAVTFSGQAPEVYETDQERGVTPINTSGIPPEWADDGISYQWHLNNHLWC